MAHILGISRLRNAFYRMCRFLESAGHNYTCIYKLGNFGLKLDKIQNWEESDNVLIDVSDGLMELVSLCTLGQSSEEWMLMYTVRSTSYIIIIENHFWGDWNMICNRIIPSILGVLLYGLKSWWCNSSKTLKLCSFCPSLHLNYSTTGSNGLSNNEGNSKRWGDMEVVTKQRLEWLYMLTGVDVP